MLGSFSSISIRIYSGLQIKLKPCKFCSMRADSRQHIMSLRLNLLCPPLWAIFRVYALYSNRNANYFYLLRKVSLADPKLSLIFCLKLDLTYCEKVMAKNDFKFKTEGREIFSKKNTISTHYCSVL